VDTGIGSAGNTRLDLDAGDRGQSRFQFALDCADTGVAGVAVEG
jgi:hypothetical protein